MNYLAEKKCVSHGFSLMAVMVTVKEEKTSQRFRSCIQRLGFWAETIGFDEQHVVVTFCKCLRKENASQHCEHSHAHEKRE